jgi:hypothetical protein
MIRTLLTGAAGAALVYFFDPENGKRRREQLFSKLRGGQEHFDRGSPILLTEHTEVTDRQPRQPKIVYPRTTPELRDSDADVTHAR